MPVVYLMQGVERRRTSRLPVELKVDYRTVGGFTTDYTKDASLEGVFIATSLPFDVGQRLHLRVSIPGQAVPLAAEGTVRWVATPRDRDSQSGMGVEFTTVDGSLFVELDRVLRSVDGQNIPSNNRH